MTLCTTTFEDYTQCTRPRSAARYVQSRIRFTRAENLCTDSARVFGDAWWARPCCALVIARCTVPLALASGLCASVD